MTTRVVGPVSQGAMCSQSGCFRVARVSHAQTLADAIRSGDSTTCFMDHDAGSVCASRTYPRECCVEPHVIEGWVAGAHLEGVSGVTLGPGVEAYHKLPEGLRLPEKA